MTRLDAKEHAANLRAWGELMRVASHPYGSYVVNSCIDAMFAAADVLDPPIITLLDAAEALFRIAFSKNVGCSNSEKAALAAAIARAKGGAS